MLSDPEKMPATASPGKPSAVLCLKGFIFAFWLKNLSLWYLWHLTNISLSLFCTLDIFSCITSCILTWHAGHSVHNVERKELIRGANLSWNRKNIIPENRNKVPHHIVICPETTHNIKQKKFNELFVCGLEHNRIKP